MILIILTLINQLMEFVVSHQHALLTLISIKLYPFKGEALVKLNQISKSG